MPRVNSLLDYLVKITAENQHITLMSNNSCDIAKRLISSYFAKRCIFFSNVKDTQDIILYSTESKINDNAALLAQDMKVSAWMVPYNDVSNTANDIAKRLRFKTDSKDPNVFNEYTPSRYCPTNFMKKVLAVDKELKSLVSTLLGEDICKMYPANLDNITPLPYSAKADKLNILLLNFKEFSPIVNATRQGVHIPSLVKGIDYSGGYNKSDRVIWAAAELFELTNQTTRVNKTYKQYIVERVGLLVDKIS